MNPLNTPLSHNPFLNRDDAFITTQTSNTSSVLFNVMLIGLSVAALMIIANSLNTEKEWKAIPPQEK